VTAHINRVSLSPAAATVIREEAVRSADGNETGGVLLGHIGPDGTAHVRHAAGPGLAAVHGPAFFLRDLHHAQRAAAEAFARDGSLWIGEWHTHPGAAPAPSGLDLATYLRFLKDPELDLDAFVAIVLTSAAAAWDRPETHAWICYPTAVQNVPLTAAPNQAGSRSGATTTTNPSRRAAHDPSRTRRSPAR
jgi:integrative and conjugative element protein (TIGR02256 family)